MTDKAIFYENLTDIQQFYAGSTIFITGGTGFIGKLVVEKLLRKCRHIKKIYLLIRDKRGKSAEERLSELFDNKAFSRIHIFNENFRTQVSLVKGCLDKDGLGISMRDKKTLIEEVNIIFHIGASVRFDMSLRHNANVNVKATREIIKLAQEMKNLKMFIYVSTAFSFSHLKNVKEKIYDIPYTPEAFMKLVNETSDEELKMKEPEIIGEWYNSYVFTKAIAEQVILTEGRDLPRAIVRPSIVLSAAKEPLPGWVDVLFGPIGSAIGTRLGVLHLAYVNEDILADYVPADYAVNHILTTAFYATKNNYNNMKVYTCSSSLQNPFYIRDYVYWCHILGKTMSSSKQYYHAWVYTTKSFMWFKILNTIIHVPPALIYDFIYYCQGKKPIAKKINERMVQTYKMSEKFNTINMVFYNENTQNMVNNMSLLDQEIFYCDISKLCWHEYIYMALKGGREFLIKDDNVSLAGFKKGINRAKWFERLHYFLIALFLYYMYLFCKLFV